MTTRWLSVFALGLFGFMAACSAEGDGTSLGDVSGGNGAANGKGGATGAGAATGAAASTGNGTSIIDTGGGGGGGFVRQPRCDANGKCTCINVASLGKSGATGAWNGPPNQPGSIRLDDTMAFVNWLNTESSAAAQLIEARPAAITLDWLRQFDVLILQFLGENMKTDNGEDPGVWKFSPEEQAAFQQWVKEGGGVISMSGYTKSALEIEPTNALISFSGVGYTPTDYPAADFVGRNYECFWGSVPVPFMSAHPIAANITQLGGVYGRQVGSNGAAGIEDVAPNGGGKAVQVEKGRVFAYADEWVTYTSMWLDTQNSDPDCIPTGETPSKKYQVTQFWYNAIKWAGQAECFTIDNPAIIK